MSRHTRGATKEKERLPLRRLIWANVLAALAMLTVGVILLWVTGLLSSILAFLF